MMKKILLTDQAKTFFNTLHISSNKSEPILIQLENESIIIIFMINKNRWPNELELEKKIYDDFNEFVKIYAQSKFMFVNIMLSSLVTVSEDLEIKDFRASIFEADRYISNDFIKICNFKAAQKDAVSIKSITIEK